jgi:hypothetical protein
MPLHAHESSLNPYFTGQISYNPSGFTLVISQLIPNDFAFYSHEKSPNHGLITSNHHELWIFAAEITIFHQVAIISPRFQ